jgi:hypothetical protein
VECNNKSDTSNNRGNWNHFKIIQKVPEQRTGKARYDIKELNKTATLDTAHIVQMCRSKVLSWEIALYAPYIVTTE